MVIVDGTTPWVGDLGLVNGEKGLSSHLYHCFFLAVESVASCFQLLGFWLFCLPELYLDS